MAKILIADDEPDIRELVRFTLQFAGHQVLVASNGEDAWKTAVNENPDLVLLDVRMPRMTGYEACREIKSNASTRDVPVIFLSAKGQESEVNQGMESGAAEYILKPFSPDQLTQRVSAILSNGK